MDVASPISPTSSNLVAALDAALDAAVGDLPGGVALAGILSPGLPPVTRERGALEPRTREAILEAVAGVPDGRIATGGHGLAGWRGYRAAVGDGRTGFTLVRAVEAGGDGRAEAAVLVLIRAALLAADRRRSDRLEQLLTTARRVAESLDLDVILADIVQDAARLVGADSGDMLLWDQDRDLLRVVAVWNFPPGMLGFELQFGEGLSSQAIVAKRTLSVDDYGSYPQRAKALDHYDFGGVLCSPLMVRGEAIGALNVHARGRAHVFGSDDADLLAAFAGHAAVAIDNARRYENEVRLGRVAAETNRELARSLTVQGRLVEQVLMDGGPNGIAAVLAEHLGRNVVIQDHLHRVIAGAAPDGGTAWRSLLEANRGHADPFSVAVRVGREVVGHLLLSSDDALGVIDRALVDIAATGVALEFAKIRAATVVEERLRGEAITDLLAGTYASEESISVRAARLGHDLSEERDLLVVDATVSSDGNDHATVSAHDLQRRHLDVVRERLAGRAPRCVADLHAGLIVVLASRARQGGGGATELAADLRGALEAVAGPGNVTIAIADPCRRPDDYARAFGYARNALELMAKVGRRGAIVSTADLGPYALLIRASSRDELHAFARRALESLTEYDRGHGAELVSTLRAYLEEDRVQRRAAERCHVHVNTVVYRLRRIEELLGLSLANPTTVFDLTLAFRILDVIDGVASPQGSRRSVR